MNKMAPKHIVITEEIRMLEKISEQINELKIEVALINERAKERVNVQEQIHEDIKEIKKELLKHQSKLDSLSAITSFISNNWKILIFVALFITSSVEIHKYFNIGH